jgi:hypothetical protein
MQQRPRHSEWSKGTPTANLPIPLPHCSCVFRQHRPVGLCSGVVMTAEPSCRSRLLLSSAATCLLRIIPYQPPLLIIGHLGLGPRSSVSPGQVAWWREANRAAGQGAGSRRETSDLQTWGHWCSALLYTSGSQPASVRVAPELLVYHSSCTQPVIWI